MPRVCRQTPGSPELRNHPDKKPFTRSTQISESRKSARLKRVALWTAAHNEREGYGEQDLLCDHGDR